MSGPFVLMYHRVAEHGPATGCWFERGTAVSPSALDRQLTWLRERFEIVPLEALHEPSAPSGRPRVALTFDDGYVDTLEVAAPICARHRVPATCFACAGPALGGPPLWFDSWYLLALQGLERGGWASALATLGFPPGHDLTACVTGAPKRWLASLGSEQRNDLLRALAHAMAVPSPSSLQLDLDGLLRLRKLGWRLGGHGGDHRRLADCTPATVADELEQSRHLLAELSEPQPRLFAYPDGSWEAPVVEAVDRAGFEIACTTDPGPWDQPKARLTIPRLFCRGDAARPHRQLSN